MKQKVTKPKVESIVVKAKEIESKEMVKVETQQINIFGTAKPKEIIIMAKELATAVASIINDLKLFTVIKNKKYVQCEGWTTMGAMLGIFPQITEVIKNNDNNYIEYVAKCEVRTLDGRLLSKAEASCSNREISKQTFEDYALRSMAETRAVSKTFRICLSWIIVLRGYEPIGSEEMEIKHTTINNDEIEEKENDNHKALWELARQKKIIKENFEFIVRDTVGKYHLAISVDEFLKIEPIIRNYKTQNLKTELENDEVDNTLFQKAGAK